MRITAAVVILIISIFMAGLALAEPSEDATQAYNSGDYKTAYRLNKSLAEQGSPEAQANLGLMYNHRRGVAQNDAEAMKWFGKRQSRETPLASST